MRRRCFAALKAMSVPEKRAASERICRRLADLESFQTAGTVFSYLPLPSEPDLMSLFDDSKTWGFPRVHDDDSMEFRKMSDPAYCVAGKCKIREPDPERCPLIELEKADLVLIPGVGFGKAGGERLGRGKGHYDRFLQGRPARDRSPLLIGICFSVQLCEVPSEKHDIPMDLVISD